MLSSTFLSQSLPHTLPDQSPLPPANRSMAPYEFIQDNIASLAFSRYREVNHSNVPLVIVEPVIRNLEERKSIVQIKFDTRVVGEYSFVL